MVFGHDLPLRERLCGDGHSAEPCGVLHDDRGADHEQQQANDVDLQEQMAEIGVATLIDHDTLTRQPQAAAGSATFGAGAQHDFS